MSATARSRRASGFVLAALSVIVSFVIPVGAGATTLRYRSVEQLAREADLVVWGRVTRVGTRMQRGQGGLRPEREAHVTVTEALQGTASGTVTVQLLGGAHPAGERRVHGEAELREGEEVVLFLNRTSGALRVLGMGMGVLRVHRAEGAEPRLLRQLEDAALLDAEGRALPALNESLSFEELRAALARARQTP